jgi:Na+/proline symporter
MPHAAVNQRDSQKALVVSGFVVLFQFALFLIIGVMLFAYARYYPLNPQSPSNDDVFPLFIVERLPHVVKGLVIAAIFAAAMSNLSGSLNSLASTSVIDFYKPLAGRGKSDESLLKLSRWSRQVSKRCTSNWSVPCEAIVKQVPPSNPAQKVNGTLKSQANEKT